jgi:hypothetical protein
MVDALLQDTNGVQVVFANAQDAGIRYTKRATTCHLKNLSEKISPKKPHRINAMVSVSPGKSQRGIDLLLRTLLHERFVVLVYRLRVLWMLWRIPWIGQFVPGSQLER